MVLDSFPKVDVNECGPPRCASSWNDEDPEAHEQTLSKSTGIGNNGICLFCSRSATNLHWYMALVYDLPINAAISVFGGTWCPKIMYNGSVIIRNHHRVITDYIGTLPLSDGRANVLGGGSILPRFCRGGGNCGGRNHAACKALGAS